MPSDYWETFANTIPDAELVSDEPADSMTFPEQWAAIVGSVDPQDRRRIGLTLWPASFLNRLPRLANALHDKLIDVRVIQRRESTFSLLYVFAHATRGPQLWLGEDPANFGDRRPASFDSIPDEARTFLSEVHAGYLFETSWEGLYQPRYMQTLAHEVGQPEDDPLQMDGWDDDDDQGLDAHKLLVIAETPGNVRYAVSPELPPETILTIDDSAQEPPEDFWTVLDNILSYEILSYEVEQG